MNKINKKIFDLILRYFLICLSLISNFYIFYFIFTPITIYPVFFILKLFYPVSLFSQAINFKSYSVEIINACVAGSAYFLLFLLNLSVPNIKLKKRILMIFSSFLIFLILNILRIVFLSFLFFNESIFFDTFHQLFWYFMSTVLIILIWFFEVYFFKISDIPGYSDAKFLYKLIKK